jgi:hypothetical protein
MDALAEQESIRLRSMHILYDVMSKMYENWSNQLEHR